MEGRPGALLACPKVSRSIRRIFELMTRHSSPVFLLALALLTWGCEGCGEGNGVPEVRIEQIEIMDD